MYIHYFFKKLYKFPFHKLVFFLFAIVKFGEGFSKGEGEIFQTSWRIYTPANWILPYKKTWFSVIKTESIFYVFSEYNLKQMNTAIKLNTMIKENSSNTQLVILNLPSVPVKVAGQANCILFNISFMFDLFCWSHLRLNDSFCWSHLRLKSINNEHTVL